MNRKTAIIGSSITAIIVTAVIGVSAFMQDQSPTSDTSVNQVLPIESIRNEPNNIPVEQTTVTPTPQPEPSQQPTPTPVADSPSPSPEPTSVEQMMVALNIPTDELQIVRVMTLPQSWINKVQTPISDECRQNYYAVLKCLNSYVLGKYGNWTVASTARSADPNKYW